jgi:hypothetical protein
MGSEEWDPPHTIRMPRQLWEDLAEAAAADHGKDRSTVLRDYARRYVAAWKGRQAKGDHDPGSSGTSR